MYSKIGGKFFIFSNPIAVCLAAIAQSAQSAPIPIVTARVNRLLDMLKDFWVILILDIARDTSRLGILKFTRKIN